MEEGGKRERRERGGGWRKRERKDEESMVKAEGKGGGKRRREVRRRQDRGRKEMGRQVNREGTALPEKEVVEESEELLQQHREGEGEGRHIFEGWDHGPNDGGEKEGHDPEKGPECLWGEEIT